MPGCGQTDNIQDVFCRLTKALPVLYSVTPVPIKAIDRHPDFDSKKAREQIARFEKFQTIYPDAKRGLTSPRFKQDQALFEKYLFFTAGIIAESQLKRMDFILGNLVDLYPDSHQVLTSLASSIRAWLPFVSFAPFISLPDMQDEDLWTSSEGYDPRELESSPNHRNETNKEALRESESIQSDDSQEDEVNVNTESNSSSNQAAAQQSSPKQSEPQERPQKLTTSTSDATPTQKKLIPITIRSGAHYKEVKI